MTIARSARSAAAQTALALLLGMTLLAALTGCAASGAPSGAGGAPDGAPLRIPDPAQVRRSAVDLPPIQVGAFTRTTLRGNAAEAAAQYRSGAAVIELTVRRYATAAAAAAAVEDWRRTAAPDARTAAAGAGMAAWTARAACWHAAETAFCAMQLAPPDDAAPLQAFLAALRWAP